MAGFGEPKPAEPHRDTGVEDLEPEPEAEDEPEAPFDEPEPLPEPDSVAANDAPDEVAQVDELEPVDRDEPPAQMPSTAVLDIAAAVAAVEQLSPPTDAVSPPPLPAADEQDGAEAADDPSEAQPAEPSPAARDADARVLAATAAGTPRRDRDAPEYDEDDVLPRFEPADLRSRSRVSSSDDEPPADTDEVAQLDLGDEREAEPDPDAGQSIGDTALPYFLVEENLPVAADPVAVATIEDLRERVVRVTPVEPTEPKPKQPASIARTLAEIPVLLIVAAVIAFLVKTFLAQAYYIPSGSMIPQLQVDDRVVVSKLTYKFHDPRRGDIVVFDNPQDSAADKDNDEGLLRKVGEGIGIVQPSTDEFIKRVIGLPGETVEGKNGHVFVNDHQLVEPYLKDTVVTSNFEKQTVKPGRLWVMGDNRGESADSRFFGQIKVDTIVGRALVKVWPFGHVSFL